MMLRTMPSTVVLLIIWPLVPLCAQEAPAWPDPSSHQVQFVTVDDNVRLEVLDWGGTGRPLVLLAGLGNTAHVYDNGKGPSLEHLKEMTTQLEMAASRLPAPTAADLASFAAYQAYSKQNNGYTFPEAEYRMQGVPTPDGSVGKSRVPPRIFQATMAGLKKFAEIRAPVLAFIAVPQNMGPRWNTTEDSEVRRILALAQPSKERVAKNIEESMPTAHVVRMPNVSHYVFLTNEGDVLREMSTFIAALK
jgi:pimeloyl-ACP methyl ester carboxylesterase